MIFKNALTIVFLSVVTGILFLTTNPDTMPSAMFVAVFCLLYALVTSLVLEVLLALRHAGFVEWRARRMLRVAAMLAAFPVFLVVLKSIGQLTVRDIILALALFILAYLYFNRVSTSPS
jgi:hypothetical protein